MKNIIIVTGGAGFIGSNLIELLLKKTFDRIISLDDYSAGTKKNHIYKSRIRYLKGNTLTWASAGSTGFKGSRKGTAFAAQTASEVATSNAVTLG